MFYSLKLLKDSIILKWNEKALESLKNVGNEDEVQDEIFDYIEPKMREKFIKLVRNLFIIYLSYRWKNS